MKIASFKHGRDGKLALINKDLTKVLLVDHIAPTLQSALDYWDYAQPLLEELAQELEDGKGETIDYDPRQFTSPLPRTYQWLDGSAYVNHVELVRKSRGVEMPESFWTDPLMYQGASDSFLAPTDDILVEDENSGIDFEAEVAVITNDVPMGVSAKDAGKHIQLVMLVNDVSLRLTAKEEMKKGFGFIHAKPSSSFSPVALTPDELGDAWKDHKLHLPIVSTLNGTEFGRPNAGVDMVFDFATLIAHAAKTRPLSAGTIIGSGTVSNKDRSVGSSCIVERILIEKMANDGKATTSFMKYGDNIRIEMLNADGKNLFGTINQTVGAYKA